MCDVSSQISDVCFTPVRYFCKFWISICWWMLSIFGCLLNRTRFWLLGLGGRDMLWEIFLGFGLKWWRFLVCHCWLYLRRRKRSHDHRELLHIGAHACCCVQDFSVIYLANQSHALSHLPFMSPVWIDFIYFSNTSHPIYEWNDICTCLGWEWLTRPDYEISVKC